MEGIPINQKPRQGALTGRASKTVEKNQLYNHTCLIGPLASQPNSELTGDYPGEVEGASGDQNRRSGSCQLSRVEKAVKTPKNPIGHPKRGNVESIRNPYMCERAIRERRNIHALSKWGNSGFRFGTWTEQTRSLSNLKGEGSKMSLHEKVLDRLGRAKIFRRHGRVVLRMRGVANGAPTFEVLRLNHLDLNRGEILDSYDCTGWVFRTFSEASSKFNQLVQEGR
jgi:hypothetical protein